jgi:hypothetical protein
VSTERTFLRGRRVAAGALAGCVAALTAAAGAAVPTDRVHVGKLGQNATENFPVSLYTTVALLPDYRAVNHFDGHSRRWQGPPYRSANLSGGATTLDWSVTFDRVASAAAMAQKALGLHPWPIAERPQLKIPHRVGTRTVGSIPAVAYLTKAPGANNAQFESVVAFPLCRGVYASATFSLTSPIGAYGTDTADTYLVKGAPALDWNHDHALAALRQVVLDGVLPLGRVTARANGRSVTGVVRDCRGDAMPGVEVRLTRGKATVARTRAAADGSFRLRAPGPGVYQASVGVLVSGNASRPNHVETRAASVTVR